MNSYLFRCLLAIFWYTNVVVSGEFFLALPCGMSIGSVTLTEHNATAARWLLSECFEPMVVVITSAACVGRRREQCATATISDVVVVIQQSSNAYLHVALVQLVNATLVLSNVSYHATNESTRPIFRHAAAFVWCNLSNTTVVLSYVDSTHNSSMFSVGLLAVHYSTAVDTVFVLNNSRTFLSFTPLLEEFPAVRLLESHLKTSTLSITSVVVRSVHAAVLLLETFVTDQSYVVATSLDAATDVLSAFNVRAINANAGGFLASSFSITDSFLVAKEGDGLKFFGVALSDARVSVVNLTAVLTRGNGFVIFDSVLSNASIHVTRSALLSSAGSSGAGVFFSRVNISSSALALRSTTVFGGSRGVFIQNTQLDISSVEVYDIGCNTSNNGMAVLLSRLTNSTLAAANSTFTAAVVGFILQNTTFKGSSEVLLSEFESSGVAFVLCAIDGNSAIRLQRGSIKGPQVALQVAQSSFQDSCLDLTQIDFTSSESVQLLSVTFLDSTFQVLQCSGRATASHFLLLQLVQFASSSMLIDQLSATAVQLVIFIHLCQFDISSVIRVSHSSVAGFYGVYVTDSKFATLQFLSSTIRSSAIGILYERSTCAAAPRGGYCIQMINTTVASTSNSAVAVSTVYVATTVVLLQLDTCNVTATQDTAILITNVTIGREVAVVLLDAVDCTLTSFIHSERSHVKVSFMSLMSRSNVSVSIRSSSLLLSQTGASADDCFVCFHNVSTWKWVSEDWVALIGAKLEVVLDTVVLIASLVAAPARPNVSAVRLSGVALEAVTLSALDVNSSSASFVSVRSAAVVSTRIYTADSTWGTVARHHQETAPTSITAGVDSVVVFSQSLGMTLTVTIVRCDGFGSGRFPAVSIVDMKLYDVSSGVFQRPSLYPVDLIVADSRFSGFTALLYRLASVPVALIPATNVTVLCSIWEALGSFRPFQLADMSGILPGQPPVNVSVIRRVGCTTSQTALSSATNSSSANGSTSQTSTRVDASSSSLSPSLSSAAFSTTHTWSSSCSMGSPTATVSWTLSSSTWTPSATSGLQLDDEGVFVVSQGAASAAVSVAVVFGSLGGVSGASLGYVMVSMQAVRLGRRLAQCDDALSVGDEIGVLVTDSPTRLSIGAHLLPLTAGATVGNSVLYLSATLVTLLVVKSVPKLAAKRHEYAAAVFVTLWQWLLVPTTAAATVLWGATFSGSVGDNKAVEVAALVWSAVAVIVLPAVAVAHVYRSARTVHGSRAVSPCKAYASERISSCTYDHAVGIVERLFHISSRWDRLHASDEGSLAPLRAAVVNELLSSCRYPHRGVIVADAVIVSTQGILAGAMALPTMSCADVVVCLWVLFSVCIVSALWSWSCRSRPTLADSSYVGVASTWTTAVVLLVALEAPVNVVDALALAEAVLAALWSLAAAAFVRCCRRNAHPSDAASLQCLKRQREIVRQDALKALVLAACRSERKQELVVVA